MPIQDIRKSGDPVLKIKADPVPKIDRKIKNLLDTMAQTMEHANGVGLAAPQIGVSLRVIVVDAGDGLLELVNPEIIEAVGCETAMEGCLSVPGFYGDVERCTTVKVKAMDRNGNPVVVEGEGLLARALQHEIDHLDGVLFIEKATSIYRPEPE